MAVRTNVGGRLGSTELTEVRRAIRNLLRTYWPRAGLLLLILALSFLSLAQTPELTPAADKTETAAPMDSADQLFRDGVKAFQDGNDERAAEFLIAAARKDPACAAVFQDPRWEKSLPPTSCPAAEPSALSAAGDPAALVLLRLAAIRKQEAREKGGEPLARKAGKYFLVQAAEKFGGSSDADRAALMLTRDGLCLQSAGYKECLEWEIKNYERFLRERPSSPLLPELLEKVAEDYWALADKYAAAAPWHSAEKAELCRGQALQLANHLAANFPETEPGRWALSFADAIKTSDRPYSIVPSSALPTRGREKN